MVNDAHFRIILLIAMVCYILWMCAECVMTPRDQLRKMAELGEQDDKHWYRLVNNMSVAGET